VLQGRKGEGRKATGFAGIPSSGAVQVAGAGYIDTAVGWRDVVLLMQVEEGTCTEGGILAGSLMDTWEMQMGSPGAGEGSQWTLSQRGGEMGGKE
jgi:hypothetical protein